MKLIANQMNINENVLKIFEIRRYQCKSTSRIFQKLPTASRMNENQMKSKYAQNT